jgi:hypothetical protein
MILAALILQAATPAVGDDVVVSALRRLRLSTDIQDGKVAACEATTSSGDAAIDAAACDATRACVADGVTAPEPLADCVDTRVGAFVHTRRAQ